MESILHYIKTISLFIFFSALSVPSFSYYQDQYDDSGAFTAGRTRLGIAIGPVLDTTTPESSVIMFPRDRYLYGAELSANLTFNYEIFYWGFDAAGEYYPTKYNDMVSYLHVNGFDSYRSPQTFGKYRIMAGMEFGINISKITEWVYSSTGSHAYTDYGAAKTHLGFGGGFNYLQTLSDSSECETNALGGYFLVRYCHMFFQHVGIDINARFGFATSSKKVDPGYESTVKSLYQEGFSSTYTLGLVLMI